MKSHGIFSCLRHNLDCIEDEMRGLCGFLGRFCDGNRRKEKYRPCKKAPFHEPDYCEERCEKCEKYD